MDHPRRLQSTPTYTARRWNIAWAGIDVAQISSVIGVLWAHWRRLRYTVLFVTTTGVLLLMDAWFDITTAGAHDLAQSLLAACLEVPLGLTLLALAARTLQDLAAAPAQEL